MYMFYKRGSGVERRLAKRAQDFSRVARILPSMLASSF